MASLGNESESKYFERLIDSIPSLIHTSRPDGYLDYFNQRWLEYLGLPMEAILGWKWTAAIHPEDVDAIVDRWRLSLASGEPFLHESRVRRADGQYRWMLHHKVAAHDERGEIVKWYGSSIDIEDRKQAEEQLRRNEFHLTEGQRLAHMGSWAFAATGFSYWSSELFRIYGLTPGGKPPTVEEYLALVHAEDRAFMKQGMAKMLDDHLAFDFTKRIVRPDGEIRRIRCVGIPVTQGGTFQGFLGTGMDVTEQERLTEELRRSGRELRDAIDTIPALVWSALPDGSNTYVNKRFVEYTGSSAEDTAGSGWQALVHPDDLERHASKWMEAVATGKPHESEVRSRRSDGQYRWHLDRGVPLRDEDGNIVKWYGVTTDIEDRKRAEDALRRNEYYLAEGQRLAHMGSWVLDPAGFFPYWSHELFHMYGLDPAKEGPSLEQYFALIHPQDLEFMTSLIKKMVAEALGCDATKRIVRPNGELRYIRCVGTPVIEDGTLQRIVGTAMDVTEHELLTRELRRREAYLAEAQRLSHTGSFGWKPDSGEIVWSEETYRIFECDHTVKPTIDLLVQHVHPEDRPAFLKVIESAAAGATQFEHTYRWLLPDGSVKHVHALAHALQDASGYREFVGAATDITSIKRAEEELRTSEAYLAEAQRLSQTGSWAWNPVTGEIRYWSEECYRVLGFDPHGPPPRFETFFQRIHPNDQAPIRERYEKAIRDKADFEFEYRLVHPDKGVRDIHVVGHAVLDRSGDFGEFVGTVIDITERKRTEQELQQLVDLVPQMSVVLGHDGKSIYANRVAREYTGLTLEEFRSKEVIDRSIHPDDLEKARAVREHGLAGSDPFELDARQLGKDGTYRWFLWRYNPLVVEGRVRRWYVSATEIESRKQEEERIRQENVRLEERTRIAQELHDTLLQNFLSASMQLGATVNGVPSDSPVKVRLDRILQLMEQGIEDGRKALQGLRLPDTAPLDLVQAFSGIQRELAVPFDVEFRLTVIGEERPLRLGIQHEIYRIGHEALINAFRHSRATRVEVELEYADSELRIRVRDNGCGLDPRVLDAGREGHWGLVGMQERAAKIGGLLKICSNANAGTEVELSIPSSIALELSLANRLSA
jgi:PAS domain S-box-containing protein